MPLPEGVLQMKVQSNSYSAEYGRTGGGIFNVITRSGSNAFHGSAFEYHQDQALNANAWFANARRQKRGVFRNNVFGGSVSGAIRRDKTFFYADYQASRFSNAGGTGAATVPTPEQRRGDFTNVKNGQGVPVVIYDPLTYDQAGTRQRDPFPGNIIPADRINPVSRNVIGLYPLPNFPGTGPAQLNNFVFVSPSTSRADQVTAPRVLAHAPALRKVHGQPDSEHGGPQLQDAGRP
jgi:hypothetical protein